jgi:hypothetical protein
VSSCWAGIKHSKTCQHPSAKRGLREFSWLNSNHQYICCCRSTFSTSCLRRNYQYHYLPPACDYAHWPSASTILWTFVNPVPAGRYLGHDSFSSSAAPLPHCRSCTSRRPCMPFDATASRSTNTRKFFVSNKVKCCQLKALRNIILVPQDTYQAQSADTRQHTMTWQKNVVVAAGEVGNWLHMKHN